MFDACSPVAGRRVLRRHGGGELRPGHRRVGARRCRPPRRSPPAEPSSDHGCGRSTSRGRTAESGRGGPRRCVDVDGRGGGSRITGSATAAGPLPWGQHVARARSGSADGRPGVARTSAAPHPDVRRRHLLHTARGGTRHGPDPPRRSGGRGDALVGPLEPIGSGCSPDEYRTWGYLGPYTSRSAIACGGGRLRSARSTT